MPDPALLEFLGAVGAAESSGVNVDDLIEERLDVRDAPASTDDREGAAEGDRIVDDTGGAERNR